MALVGCRLVSDFGSFLTVESRGPTVLTHIQQYKEIYRLVLELTAQNKH